MTLGTVVTSVPPQEDIVSSLALKAKGVFEEKKEENVEPLQNLFDALTAKVVAIAFEVFRDPFDALLRLLRNSYGQIARFVDGDFRQDPSFYLGQLHALGEVAHRLAHQRVPREAVELVARSQVMENVVTKVVEEGSIGATDLARELGMAESNLSATCKLLVEKELLRRHRFGKRVRYAPTPLTYAVATQLRVKERANAAAVGAAFKGVAKAAAAAASAAPAPDWPKVSVTAAADSFEPGSNVMANISDFVSGLLTLAEFQGARQLAIEPSGDRVRLEANEKGTDDLLLNLPKSVGHSLSEQVKACAAFSSKLQPTGGAKLLDWRGQRLAISSEQTGRGPRFKVKFIGTPNPHMSKSKARVAFQEIQNERTRLQAFQKVYVGQILKGCEGRTSEAAEVLGMGRAQFVSLIKELNIRS